MPFGFVLSTAEMIRRHPVHAILIGSKEPHRASAKTEDQFAGTIAMLSEEVRDRHTGERWAELQMGKIHQLSIFWTGEPIDSSNALAAGLRLAFVPEQSVK
jgi:hypothetical protein